MMMIVIIMFNVSPLFNLCERHTASLVIVQHIKEGPGQYYNQMITSAWYPSYYAITSQATEKLQHAEEDRVQHQLEMRIGVCLVPVMMIDDDITRKSRVFVQHNVGMITQKLMGAPRDIQMMSMSMMTMMMMMMMTLVMIMTTSWQQQILEEVPQERGTGPRPPHCPPEIASVITNKI